MILSFALLASVGVISPHALLAQSGSTVDQSIETQSGSSLEQSIVTQSGSVAGKRSTPTPIFPSHTYFQPSLDETLYCRAGACQIEIRRRSVKRRKFRWSPPAVSPTHGGGPSTIDELQERYGSIPHRRIRRIRQDLVKSQTEERDKRFFELRALLRPDAVPDTVGKGKKNCRSETICIDPVQERRERRENERRVRGGKAKERASFFSGGGPRTQNEVGSRYGLKHLQRERNVKPISERGLPVPRKRNLRTY